MTIQSKLVLFSIAFFFFSSAPAAVVPLTNQPDWLLNFTGDTILTESFSGSQTDFSANSTANALGLIALSLLGGEGDSGPTGLTGSGFFQGEVDASGNDALSLQFSFDKTYGFALTGLQNDSVSNPSPLRLDELALSIGAQYWVLSSLAGSNEDAIPFLGFVSDHPIDSFTLFHAGQVSPMTRTSEEFYLDGFRFVQSAATVDEPPVSLILLSGFSGLLIVFRLRRRWGSAKSTDLNVVIKRVV